MPTQTQDPTDPYTLRIERLRRLPRPRGLAGLVHDMFLEFFVRLLTLLASIANQRPTGTLPDPAPAPQQDVSPRPTAPPDQPRLPPPDPPEPPPIAEAPQVDPIVPPPCRMPGVEPPAVPPPRRARVRKLKHPSGPTPARPQPVDNCRWPRPRGADPLCTREAALLRFDSKRSVWTRGDSCVHFVTI